jgi:hypothetical protein
MRLDFDIERVRANARAAATEDLLDRVTVYRAGMEPAALDVIEAELRSRGVSLDQIDDHAARRDQEVLLLEDGTAARCSFCRNPAVAAGWGFHRLWRRIPLFPRYLYYCQEHRPASLQGPGAGEDR